MEKLNYITIGFILGLISSIHCFSMCGPITFFFSLERENKIKMLIKNLLYQIGRIISYILLGFIFGIIGYEFALAGFQKKLSLFLGGNLICSFFFKKKYNIYFFLKKIISLIFFFKKKSFFIIGILNGLLPCSIVYIAISIAISIGNIFWGVMFMFYFGLGTVPMMFTTFSIGKYINFNIKNILLNNITILTLIIGILLLIRGLGLGLPYVSPIEYSLLTKQIIKNE
ncbi:sulfite exporter TauE/SafE family protein [Candidatus Karelsulcia muelleri]|uniref:Urease accessory protein UreH-like transmembrane domain-containing protein n=1 Tax=Candidatus Karelsulcia muelleri PSPU TaxID=1189303 RepID=A0AAD1B0E3_9FLAO|nr:sulfite exporter TauE/SafE family protein [Candidatus Karelsulcia muelleri]NJJ98659.1 sulfite exporter TauE/SafE family protein [Candidatus Karelsulcia muelleri]BAO66317.1 hypothetical protein SMPSPU_161 [Candidatus Karelsulcia muelleri PSPU]